MLRVGLTGGLASGKSLVGRALADLGCYVIEADVLGRQVLEQGGETYDAVIAAFGNEILDPDGKINRRRLAAIVFADSADAQQQLARLNALVHPPVKLRERDLADEFARSHPDGIVVTEAAILVETGSYKDYDRLIVAVCRPEQQIERSIERDGVSREEVLRRLRRQMPLEEKVKYADFIIDTSGSKEATLQQVRTVYEALRRVDP
ncbi:MAG TPA: dephospho-CoA kinase [Bryobacteraceae bacterium]|jgi:dephospho-CoA kinase|nr:dephospho-CoA kinase [Bryobacteraceae bacterium]